LVAGTRARPGKVRLHAPNLHRMTIGDVLDGLLPPGILGDPFLNTLADPQFALVHQLGESSEPARMVQGSSYFMAPFSTTASRNTVARSKGTVFRRSPVGA
jgi:hypothetical protein